MSDGETTWTADEAPLDWRRFDAMTDGERRAAALADPDVRPLSEGDPDAMPPAPQARVVRRALGLSQEAFSRRFQVLLGTLRDGEQRRMAPDGAARAYLGAIASCPEAVAAALAARAA